MKCRSSFLLALSLVLALAGAAGAAEPQDTARTLSPPFELPLVELPAASGITTAFMAVHLTGDGGWGITDAGLSKSLAARGIPVAGINALKYFWTKRTPDECSRDLDRIITYYSALWGRSKVILIGYSFGADVMPFMYNKLPPSTRNKVALLVEIGPSKTADFYFHLSSWFGFASENSLPVLPQLERITTIPLLSVVGDDDNETIGRNLHMPNVTPLEVKAGHRVGGNYDPILQAILKLSLQK